MNDPTSKKPKIAMSAYIFFAFVAAVVVVVFTVSHMQRSKTEAGSASVSK